MSFRCSSPHPGQSRPGVRGPATNSSGSNPGSRAPRAVVTVMGEGDRVFDDGEAAGRALPVRRFVPAAGDHGGDVTGPDGDRSAAGSAVDDGDDGPSGVVGVW